MYDLTIIGAGSAGISAYKVARKHTDNIALLQHGSLGTTCARVGCMPSKALIHPAFIIGQLHKLQQEGLVQGELKADQPAILRHVRTLRDRFAGSAAEETESFSGFEEGAPRFMDDHHLEVNGRTIETRATIIATGTSPRIPKAFESVKDYCLTTDTLFEQDDVPERIGIIGMGAIGAEMACALSALGCDVVAFQRTDTIAGLAHPELNQMMIAYFRKHMQLEMRADVQAELKDGSVCLTANEKSYHVDKVLIAAGRAPNLNGLQLENTSASLNEQGFPHFDPYTLKLENAPIYMAGDVNKCYEILHEAVDEGKFAARHALGLETGDLRRTPLTMVFTHPNIASIGISYDQAVKCGAAIGSVDFSSQGRSRIILQNDGRLYLYADRQTGQLLGAEMVAPAGEHMAHLLALAIGQKLTVEAMLTMPFYHPVVEEGLKTALVSTLKAIKK